MEQEEISFLASKLLLTYGDLLKVSRMKGMNIALPVLRRTIKQFPAIAEEYKSLLSEEINGQGLSDNVHLKSLQEAQYEQLIAGSPTNNTSYAEEIKKIITAGRSDHVQGQQVHIKIDTFSEGRVIDFIENPLGFDLNSLSTKECDEIRKRLLGSFKQFSLWAFQIQMGFKFMCQDYHEVMFEFCDKIIRGEKGFHRTVINIPPRAGKTQVICIFLPLFAFCHNAGSHNMLLSFNEGVVLESSGHIRTLMTHEIFMKVFPDTRIDQSKRSLDKWGTTKAGVLHALTPNGQVTGKGAGSLSPVFSGIQCIDDYIKPVDALSGVARNKSNENYVGTLLSRLACDGFEEGGVVYPATPQVIIMQRLHDSDLCGFLFRGGSGAKFQWLNIPAIIEEGTGSKEYYDKLISKNAYTHAVPYIYDLGRKGTSSFWEARKSLESLLEMKKSDPYTFAAQYMGDPTAKGTGLIQDEWFRVYDPRTFDYNKIMSTFIVADTASTTKTYSDYTVLAYVGLGDDGNMYFLDFELGKWDVVDVENNFKDFWHKHSEFDIEYPRMAPWFFYCEDKSSGQYIIQQVAKNGDFTLTPIPRDKSSGDKLVRFLNTIPFFSKGKIFFPEGHKHLPHVQREITSYTNQGSGTGHDDVVDVVSDAVAIGYSTNTDMNYSAWG